jgi:septal ring factor EnvC (AmiA/AmiB activator)
MGVVMRTKRGRITMRFLGTRRNSGRLNEKLKIGISTIIILDAELTRLEKRVAELESGITSIGKENDRLRERIKILERNENKLSGVNV